MPLPVRGEIWLADLGMAAKVRPVLVFNVAYTDKDYALLAVIPHTTSPRGAAFEIDVPAAGLKPGVFNIQGLMAVPTPKLFRRLGRLDQAHMESVEVVVEKWLGLTA